MSLLRDAKNALRINNQFFCDPDDLIRDKSFSHNLILNEILRHMFFYF